MNFKRAIIMMFIVYGIYLFSNYNITMQHEYAHQQIFRWYGCESQIELQNITITEVIWATKPINCSFTNEDFADMRKLHLQNEIVGYHMIAFFDGLWLIIGVIIIMVAEFLVFDSNDDKEINGKQDGVEHGQQKVRKVQREEDVQAYGRAPQAIPEEDELSQIKNEGNEQGQDDKRDY